MPLRHQPSTLLTRRRSSTHLTSVPLSVRNPPGWRPISLTVVHTLTLLFLPAHTLARQILRLHRSCHEYGWMYHLMNAFYIYISVPSFYTLSRCLALYWVLVSNCYLICYLCFADFMILVEKVTLALAVNTGASALGRKNSNDRWRPKGRDNVARVKVGIMPFLVHRLGLTALIVNPCMLK